MFHKPHHVLADVPRTDAQVMERAGSSRNAENGSHLVPDEGIYAVFAFRYEPIRRKRLTPGSDGCRRGPCEADGVPAIADKSWGGFWR